jgi:hypothetical protein
MKILFLNSNKFDYLQDIVYSGLVKTLGFSNVLSVPFNKSYYFNFKEYPKNLGFNNGGLFQNLINRLTKFDFDVVIVGSTKKLPFDLYNKILLKIPYSCPVVFLDGGDFSEIGGDLTRLGYPELYDATVMKRPFDLIFKREMFKNQDYAENVYPCPFAFNLDRIRNVKAVSEKKYDVAFWAGESHEDRKKSFDLLKGKYDCDQNGTSKGQTLKSYDRKGDFYFEEVKRCKITINVRGNGWDTLRFWEIPALGSFMLSQELDIIIPNDFKDGLNISYFAKDFSNFYEKIDYFLENEIEREKISKAGYNHLVKYHTDIVRAQYIIDKIKLLIG